MMGNLSCCCTEICGECLSEDVEPPPTTPTPPPPRRRRRRRKKRVRFSLHDEVYTIKDTEEDPVAGQSKDLPRCWTEEGTPTLPEVSLLEGDGDPLASLYDGLDVDSRVGEAPLFTMVVALLERERVLPDLLVESIEDYSHQ